MRAQGGRGKHNKICLCLAQSIFFELPRPVNEGTESQTTTKRREEAPRLAARTERRNERQGITISDKIELAHFAV